MSKTYTQIHLQLVFAVKYRNAVIDQTWKPELYKYITGIVRNNNHKILAINGMPDHVHILVGMRPTQSVSGLLKDIKGSSSKWINDKKFCSERFEWQEGYGAFSYGASQVDYVMEYIKNQEAHHQKKTFIEEYTGFLKIFKIDFEEVFIFKELE